MTSTITLRTPIKGLKKYVFHDVRDLYITIQKNMEVQKTGIHQVSLVDKWVGKGKKIADKGDIRIAYINSKHVK